LPALQSDCKISSDQRLSIHAIERSKKPAARNAV
jgi:hypothetical protein